MHFGRHLLSEAKEIVNLATSTLKGDYKNISIKNHHLQSTASEYSSGYSSNSSGTSSGSSTPGEEAHDEMKKLLLGSERLATALEELKNRLRGNIGETERKDNDKEEQSHFQPDSDSLAEGVSEARMVVRRALTDLETDIKTKSRRKRQYRRKKISEEDKPKLAINPEAKANLILENSDVGSSRAIIGGTNSFFLVIRSF